MNKVNLKGSLTEQNLLKAFAGECQARSRYQFFAKQASKEGYELIANYFLETATNEDMHSKIYFRLLEGGMVEITASYPAGIIGTTEQNLAAAAEGEYDEWANLYPEFSKIASDEGFTKAALAFERITKIERFHEMRYSELLKELKDGAMFARKEAIEWECMKCGYRHNSKDAPQVCPVCSHPQGYFEPFADIY